MILKRDWKIMAVRTLLLLPTRLCFDNVPLITAVPETLGIRLPKYIKTTKQMNYKDILNCSVKLGSVTVVGNAILPIMIQFLHTLAGYRKMFFEFWDQWTLFGIKSCNQFCLGLEPCQDIGNNNKKKTIVLINGIFDHLEEFIAENEETNDVNVRFLMFASKLVGLKKLLLYYQKTNETYIFACSTIIFFKSTIVFKILIIVVITTHN